ncbi:hypothetical protein ACLB1N_23230 [Escherichia coli]
MAQRDYVRRSQPAPSRRKKSAPHGKSNEICLRFLPLWSLLLPPIIVTFIGGLYFITHHKKEESETLQSQKVTGNGLPPKPEEDAGATLKSWKVASRECVRPQNLLPVVK